jgi:hypothetical protein
MTIERIIRIMAGSMILLALALAHFSGQVDLSRVSWLWLVVFIGLNLLQSGFTGFCPPEKLLRRLGFKEGGGACRS